MPRVFTGQVAIPGDQVEAYLAALAEEARCPFRQYLEGLRAEFEQYLAARYTRRTARKHVQRRLATSSVTPACSWRGWWPPSGSAGCAGASPMPCAGTRVGILRGPRRGGG